MQRYLIERDLPGVGGASPPRTAAVTPSVDDEAVCVRLTENEAAGRGDARLSGLPASDIAGIRAIIDPMTAMS